MSLKLDSFQEVTVENEDCPEQIHNMHIYRRCFTIIAAMCEKTRGIGYQGSIPWKSKEDMAFFRTTTTNVPSYDYNNAVIMGRKTFESLDSRPLKGRLNVVCSHTMNNVLKTYANLLFATSLDEISQHPGKIHKIFVIGGEQLYREGIAHPECSELMLNYMKIPVREYDTFFPEINPKIYELIDNDETDDIVYTRRIHT